jgi:DNA gyrase/topoisomerase IV subunit B
MSFSKGVPVSTLENRPRKAADIPQGTKIIFKPDPLIFKSTVKFDVAKVVISHSIFYLISCVYQISSRLDELAYLNPGLTLS